MSAGKFIDSIYQNDAGDPVNIRIQPETLTTFNTVGVGTPASNLPTAKVGGSRRGYGIHARIARFKWNGAVPDGYDPQGIVVLPILTLAKFTGLQKNVDYPYLAGSLNLIGKSGEAIR